MNIKPDGYMGVVLAFEGMSDTTVLLHGPQGCRMLLCSAAGSRYPRPDDNIDLGTPYYRGMTRIPNTDVTPSDYIYGAYPKVVAALNFIKTKDPALVVVVNSPGASLIGDDCFRASEEAGMSDRTIVMDSKLMSEPYNVGIDEASLELLRKVAPERKEKVKGTVNLLGLNILMKDWSATVREFGMMFGLMGLKVTCSLCAGNSVQEAADSATAECNVVLCPEFCRRTAEFYEEVHGIESVGLGYAPVGFRDSIDLIRMVAEKTGTDPSPALEYVKEIVDRAYKSFDSSFAGLTGKTFAVEAYPSIAYPLVKMLYTDFSMIPVMVRFNGVPSEEAASLLDGFIEAHGLGPYIGDGWPEECEAVFADGNTAHLEQMSGHCRAAVDIGYPSSETVDFRFSPVMGPSGVLYILDRIANRLPN